MRTTTPPAGRRRRSLLVTAVAALLPACAVLTIDVDVYKGPLTTDPDLQLEQAASLADGVRPLLTELRDRREWGNKQPPENVMYQPGYIDEFDRTTGKYASPFNDPTARAANGLLGLYEDLHSAYMADVEAMLSVINDSRRSWNLYRPQGDPEIDRMAKSLAEQLDKKKGDKTHVWAGFFRGKTGTAEPYRDEERLFTESENEDLSANARFQSLSESSTLKAKVPRVYTDANEQDEQAKFEREFLWVTTRISNGFLHARESREKLFMQLLDLVDSLRWNPSLTSGKREDLVSRAIDCISLLVEPAYLRAVLELDRSETNARELLDAWRRLHGDDLSFDLLCSYEAFDYPASRRSLSAAIRLNVDGAVRAIRRANMTAHLVGTNGLKLATLSDSPSQPWKPEKPGSVKTKSAIEYFNMRGRLMFGVVASASDHRGGKPTLADELERLSEFLGTIGGSGVFDDSRLQIGLSQQIREYRAMIAQSGHMSSDSPSDVRARLLDSLAAFGMRILAFVNTSQVVATDEMGPLCEYGTDVFEATFGNSKRSNDNPEVRVLQAIGNILVAQVDLIAAHDHNIRERGLGAEGLRRALSGQNSAAAEITGDTLSELETKLRVRLGMKQAELAAARASPKSDDPKTVRIEELEKGVTDLDAAVRSIQSLRQDSVFIRPASTYLRAANPATELQDGSAIGWRNLLKEHAAHQEPLDTLIPEGARNKRLLTERIDRQSWQNINQIRVAAGGDTTYALVKDDIGNWYVKGFSGDPKPVIDAAQGIALGAYGARVGVDAFAVADGSVSASDAAKQTTESRQLRAMRERYAAAAKDDLRTLDAEYAELANRIGSDWSTSKAANAGGVSASSVLPRIRALQKTSIAAWRSTVPDGADAKTREYVRAIHEGIASLRRFADAARAAIDAETQAVTGDPAVSARREAQRIVVSRTHEIVERAWARRDAAEKAASDGIGVVFPGGPAD